MLWPKSPSAGACTEPDPALLNFPRAAFLGHVLIRAGLDGQDGRNGHHDLQVTDHVMAELVIGDLCAVVVAQHETGYQKLLVDAADHNLLVDGLILFANEIAVEVYIQVVEGLHIRQRLEYENIIHIEGMLRQLQSTSFNTGYGR